MKQKKIFLDRVFLVVVCATFLISCANKNGETATATDSSQASAATPTTYAPPTNPSDTLAPHGKHPGTVKGIGTMNIGNLISLPKLGANGFYTIRITSVNAPDLLLVNAHVYSTAAAGPGVIGVCQPGSAVIVPTPLADADGEAVIVPHYTADGQNYFPFTRVEKTSGGAGPPFVFTAHSEFDKGDNTIVITVTAN
jgi:hypothetical protein